MDFIDPKIEQYAIRHTAPETELLEKINRDTWAEVLMPRMLSGPLQGRILAMFSKMVQPRVILEIGTYTGYSAICLAEGLQTNGKLITIDINDELEKRVRGYFAQCPNPEKFDYRVGNALAIIPQIHETIDLVFIDADKVNYYAYYELVFEKVAKGGIIIADNVLWSGKILDPAEIMDEDTLALSEFNRMVSKDKRVDPLLLPVRDGLMVLRKK